MNANFQVIDGQIKSFDKLVIVYNFHALNEVVNMGFSYKKAKISNRNNISGVWHLKRKINS